MDKPELKLSACRVLGMYTGISKKFCKISGAFLAPSQRLLYYWGDANPGTPEQVSFSYEYIAGKKVYKENIELTMVTGAASSRPNSKDAIKYALQDIAERLI